MGSTGSSVVDQAGRAGQKAEHQIGPGSQGRRQISRGRGLEWYSEGWKLICGTLANKVSPH